MSSSSSCRRGTRHLHRSQTAPYIIPGATECSAQHCRTIASTTVCSLFTSQTSLVPQNLHSGMKSHHTRLLRLGGAFHQPAAGNLKPAACFLARSCAWPSLSCPGLRGLELQPPDWGLVSLSQVGPDPVCGGCHWVW